MTVEIKKIIHKYLKEKKQEVLEREKLEDIINNIFDNNLKPHVRLLKLSGSRLVFLTDSSAAKFQINLMKPEILKICKQIIPSIDKIIVRLGKINHGGSEQKQK